MRGTIAKALIAFAVLLPVMIVLMAAVKQKMQIYGVHIGNLTPWFVGDAILLGIGLLLHRGEEL